MQSDTPSPAAEGRGGMLTEDQEKILARHLAALDDDARAMDATADLFRPEFDACWNRTGDGKMAPGPIQDSERAMQLRGLVLDGPRNAKYNRELAGAIRVLLAGREALSREKAE